jgi:hypothetical protein
VKSLVGKIGFRIQFAFIINPLQEKFIRRLGGKRAALNATCKLLVQAANQHSAQAKFVT